MKFLFALALFLLPALGHAVPCIMEMEPMHCEEAMPGCVEQMTVAECGEEKATFTSVDLLKKSNSGAILPPMWMFALMAGSLLTMAYVLPQRRKTPEISILKTTQRLRI